MPTGQVRTTVYLDEELYIAAKKKAAEERRTLTSLIQEGLKEQVAKKVKPKYKKEDWEKTVERLAGGIKLKKYPTPEELNRILDDRYAKMLPR